MQKRTLNSRFSTISRFFMVALALLALTGNASAAAAGRIYCQGTELMADGSRIYLNGANTPWNSWNEFGGSAYDAAWWNAEFGRLKAKGINSARVWICCNGTTHPNIDTAGNVTGASATFWANVDSLMSLAQANQIYVMASMMSFDFADPYIWDYGTNAHSTKYLAWTSMLKSSSKVQTMIDNFIIPFVVRYKDNPFLYAIDLCNEPEWINQNAGGGGSGWVVVTWAELQRYVAMSAVAIHNSGSQVLVTLGSAGAKWNSAIYENNYWSDALLQAQVANDKTKARLDFFQLHYYYWMEPYFPLRKSAAELQLADRPLVMGEMPGKPLNGSTRLLPVGETLASLSEYFFANGFSGHYPWTSNGVDVNGSLTDFGAAALAFQQAHPTVIRFPSTGTAQTITFPTIATQNWTGSNLSISLGATASSGLTVAYSVTSGPATASGSTLTITGSGSVAVAANQAGNVTYQAATQVLRTITVNDARATQTITFPAIATQTWIGPNVAVTLGATASSNLTVSYSVTSGPATVSGSTLTITGSGSVVVAANQAGSASFAAASPVSRTVTVNDPRIPQTITFPTIATQTWISSDVTVTLGATASSNLTVSYSVTSGPATVTGSTLTITGSGSVVVAASQAGNTSYATASPVARTVIVSNGQTPTDSSASSSDSGSCGMGSLSAMLILMMFGFFQRSLVTERLRGRFR